MLAIKKSAVIFTVICLVFMSRHLLADDLLPNCSDVLELSAYKPLKDHLSTSKWKPHICQRLNDTHYLYSTESAIFSCTKQTAGVLSCTQSWKARDLNVVKRFYGANGKQFVVLQSERLSQGVYSNAYFIFFLVPKSVEPSGVQLFSPIDVYSYSGVYSELGKPCSHLPDRENASMVDPNLSIIDDNGAAVAIQFVKTVVDCADQRSHQEVLNYRWDGVSYRFFKEN